MPDADIAAALAAPTQMMETLGTQMFGSPLGQQGEKSDMSCDDDGEPLAPVRKAKAKVKAPPLPRRSSSRVQGVRAPDPGPLATAGAKNAPNGGESAAAGEA